MNVSHYLQISGSRKTILPQSDEKEKYSHTYEELKRVAVL